MLDELKREVLAANLALPKERLAILTWGNVSGITGDRSRIVIKASGVEYERMTAEHMTVVGMDGESESGFRPSTDLDTHLELYGAFGCANAVVHAHSPFATAWAQAGREIPCVGTTHADHFGGDVPCTRRMTAEEINGDYERNTGRVIVETFRERSIDPERVNAVLVHSHGPFVWGKTPGDAVKNAVTLEYIAKMAYLCAGLRNFDPPRIQPELLARHYNRKFGEDAYYGQE